MHEFKLTWHGAVHGDITIVAESATRAKAKLAEMTFFASCFAMMCKTDCFSTKLIPKKS